MSDWLLANGTEEFREEERRHRNRLPLSWKGVHAETADDYTCDFCDAPATGYLFLGHQFCDTHNPDRGGRTRGIPPARGDGQEHDRGPSPTS